MPGRQQLWPEPWLAAYNDEHCAQAVRSAVAVSRLHWMRQCCLLPVACCSTLSGRMGAENRSYT